jgi:hypothetical protein
MMNMASAAARYSPTAKAATAATQIARSAEMRFSRSSPIADGAVEGLVARQQGQKNRRVDPENFAEQAGDVEQQQEADERRESDVFHALGAVLVDGVMFVDDVHRVQDTRCGGREDLREKGTITTGLQGA